MPDAIIPWLLGVISFFVVVGLFSLLVTIFYLIGQQVGNLIAAVEPPLTAYTLNLLGSLAGTITYTGLVFFALPPWVWMAPIFACLVYTSRRWLRDGLILSGAFVIMLIAEIYGSNIHWSPYYRISYVPTVGNSYSMAVDHDYHQDLLNLTPQSVADYPGLREAQKHYNFPYAIAPTCEKILIAGAGTGNDVAAALRAGCKSIDAVELDPTIIKLGSMLHPERPYDSEKVKVVVNDARAFFHQAQPHIYDMAIFGFVDSLTALSMVSSLRLEFFLYSVESFREILALLNPKDGLLIIGLSVGWKDWVGQRIYRTLRVASGQEPLVLKTSQYVGALTFIVGPGLPKAQRVLAGLPEIRDMTQNFAHTRIRTVTDDWPFLYYNPHTLPFVYLVATNFF